MRTLLLTLLFFFSFFPLQSQTLKDYKPNLKEGDIWGIQIDTYTVAARRATKGDMEKIFIPEKHSVVYTFNVKKVIMIDNFEYYNIIINCSMVDGKKIDNQLYCYEILLRSNDFSLYCFKRKSFSDNKILFSKKYLNSKPVIESCNWIDALPIAFPVFDDSKLSESKPIYTTCDDVTQKSYMDSSDGTTCLFIEYSQKNQGTTYPKIIQKWEKNKCWWSIQIFEKDGESKEKAKLIIP